MGLFDFIGDIFSSGGSTAANAASGAATSKSFSDIFLPVALQTGGALLLNQFAQGAEKDKYKMQQEEALRRDLAANELERLKATFAHLFQKGGGGGGGGNSKALRLQALTNAAQLNQAAREAQIQAANNSANLIVSPLLRK